MSVPGQTMGMAVFADPFITAFDLSRTQLSVAYLFGTIGSAVLLTRAGRLYDRLGARVMLVSSSLLLGLVVGLISGLDLFATWLSAHTNSSPGLTSFSLILVGYFLVRLSGQGVLTNASRNVLLEWFVERRGLVSGVRGVFVSLGFSLAPLGLAFLIDHLGWRGALWALAVAVGLGFSLLCLIFIRDRPEECGVLPDGKAQPNATPQAPVSTDKTAAQARRSPIFWIYATGLSVYALFGTAVTFHIVAIFEEAGRTRAEAFGYFFPQAIVSTLVNITTSWLADFNPLKPFLVAMLVAFSLGAYGLLNLHTYWGYWLLVVGFGAGSGLWGTVSNLAFVRYFGRRHLGEVSGLSASLTVFASAIGPALFSLGSDTFGSYHAAEWLCLGVLICLTAATIMIRQNEPLS